MKLIKSITELKELCTELETVDCFIMLNGGARSSKDISYSEGTFYVYNNIDDTEQHLTEKELYTDSNIGEAIDKKALYKY